MFTKMPDNVPFHMNINIFTFLDANIWEQVGGYMDQWYVRMQSHDINQPITVWYKICDGVVVVVVVGVGTALV